MMRGFVVVWALCVFGACDGERDVLADADTVHGDTVDVVDVVPDTVDVPDVVDDTVVDIVPDTVDVVPDVVDDMVVDVVPDVVDDTVADVVPDTVDDAVADVVPDTVEDTADVDSLDSRDSWVSSEPPRVSYALTSPRRLFFLNNPEQLLTTELGDSDLMDATLLRVTADGPSRSFFEHVNKSGRTIGFGIQAYNPGPGVATIAVEGVGFTVGIEGGRPFAQALSNEGATTFTLNAGQSAWLLRRDEVVPHGSFFSGVVDFTVTGSVTLNHIAYDRFDRLDGSTAERDYVTRIEPDGTSEARMYKGVASASEAALELAVTVSADTSGPLAVKTRRFDLATQSYVSEHDDLQWVSHIGPSQNTASSVTDMVSFVFRAWTFDPLVKSDAEGKYPNLGNWGVVYRTQVVVENRDTRPRTVTWRVQASPGAGAGLAKRAGTGSASPDPRGGWTAHHLAANATLNVASVTVPAGERRTLEGALVLGGPSGGALRNTLVADP